MHSLDALRQGALHGATRLTLREDLREFPPEIYSLADSLEILDLSGNQLDTLPDELPRLHRLRVLFCSNNRFQVLPPVLGQCPQLDMVGFKSNQIHTVPAAALPPRLRWLILTDNRLETLPDELGRRPRLQKLALAGNRLRALPDTLAQCRQLELLRVSANQLPALPAWLPGLPRLAWLAHGGNPFSLGAEAAAREQAPLPPVAWQDLALEDTLGAGASGVIHRVRRADGTPAALKVFKGEVTSDGLPTTELAASLQAGTHPQLIGVQGRLHGHPSQAQGLLMPLVDARFRPLAGPPSLDSCTRDVYPTGLRFTPQALCTMAAGLASALAHLHARGLTHGDLYAHNILHDGQGQALLGDFGAASFLVADMPPPQARALQAVDVRALGILLEELMACCDAPGTVPAATAWQPLAALSRACQDEQPERRPTAAQAAQTAGAAAMSARPAMATAAGAARA